MKDSSVAEWFGASFLRRPSSQDWWYNSNPSLVVASLDKMRHGNYLCLEECKQQEAKFKRKNRKQGQLLSESGFVLCIAPSSLSRDRRIKIKKSSSSRTVESFQNAQHIFCMLLSNQELFMFWTYYLLLQYRYYRSPLSLSYIRLWADSKDKANMLIAATKSDDLNNINWLKWSLIVTKLLPHKKQINGNVIT